MRSLLDTLISNVTIVTMNERMEILFGAYIGVADGKIVSISKTAPETPPATIVDGTGMVAIPGLINCHTQLAATALRGYLDNLSGREALEQLLLKEAKMDSRCAKAAATLGIAECLRFGITSVSDLYYYPEATAQAVQEAGIKASLALSAYRFEEDGDFDFETDQQCRELVRLTETWHGHDNGRIRIDAGLHAQYTSNHPLWQGLSSFASEKGLSFQLNLAQEPGEGEDCLDRTGLLPAQLLRCHGLFGVPTTAAGCGYLDDEEIALLGKHHVTAVSLPLTAGRAGRNSVPVGKCVKAGMNVALGTGGAQLWGNMDLFETMRAMVLDARRAAGDPAAMPASAALMMATVCGARAQGRSEECGMLKEGFDADIVLVDFSAPHLMPCHDVLNGLVFSAKGGDVAMTMVRGKILYQNGAFPTLDLKGAVAELTSYAIPKLFS